MNGVWQLIRAKLAYKSKYREQVKFFGFRIAEPHKDGTPHWHIALYLRPDQVQFVKDVISDYALREDGDERGADKHRVDFMDEDETKGSLIGYFAKYISKNIDGRKTSRHSDGGSIGEDLENGGDAVETARRVEAWATCWGVRQFQQLGAVSVSVWRELRAAISQNVLDLDNEYLAVIAEAADSGDWAAFCEAMGGVLAGRDELAVRILRAEVAKQNAYGEEFRKIIGVVLRAVHRYVTRIHKWMIQPAGTFEKDFQRFALQGAPPRAA